jgi:hypothetical protein
MKNHYLKVEHLVLNVILKLLSHIITQSYNDIIDPPEETIPLCTLEEFPLSNLAYYPMGEGIFRRNNFSAFLPNDIRKFY